MVDDERLVRAVIGRLGRWRAKAAQLEVSDLVQAGLVACVQARKRFDGSRGVKWETYAQHRIVGAVLDAIAAGRFGHRPRRGGIDHSAFESLEDAPAVTAEAEVGFPHRKVVHGKVRWVVMDECPVCSRRFLRRVDRRSAVCSIPCANSHRLLDREVKCSVCLRAFWRQNRRNTRCRICRRRNKMPRRTR